jgi:hypothetical protein
MISKRVKTMPEERVGVIAYPDAYRLLVPIQPSHLFRNKAAANGWEV